MNLRAKIVFWWVTIILSFGFSVFVPFAGAIAGWLPLISRIWISFISKKVAYFAISLFVLSAICGFIAISLSLKQANFSDVFWGISITTSLMFLIVIAISDFISFKGSKELA